jgi:hypothetical protein
LVNYIRDNGTYSLINPNATNPYDWTWPYALSITNRVVGHFVTYGAYAPGKEFHIARFSGTGSQYRVTMPVGDINTIISLIRDHNAPQYAGIVIGYI